MEICWGKYSSSAHLLHLLIISHSTIFPYQGDESVDKKKRTKYNQKQAPDATERGIGFNNQWESLLHQVEARLDEPPLFGFKVRVEGTRCLREVEGCIKNELETSKETVERSAAATTKAVEEALGKTKEKLKKSVSTSDGGSTNVEL